MKKPVDLGENTKCLKCEKRYCVCKDRRIDGSLLSEKPKRKETPKGWEIFTHRKEIKTYLTTYNKGHDELEAYYKQHIKENFIAKDKLLSVDEIVEVIDAYLYEDYGDGDNRIGQADWSSKEMAIKIHKAQGDK